MYMNTTVAEISSLQKSFGTNHVLKNMNLQISKGENLVVFGKSGSGKSVLIKCLVGSEEPDSGTVVMLGKNIIALENSELNVLRKKIGFSFQSAALYDSVTVLRTIEFALLYL